MKWGSNLVCWLTTEFTCVVYSTCDEFMNKDLVQRSLTISTPDKALTKLRQAWHHWVVLQEIGSGLDFCDIFTTTNRHGKLQQFVGVWVWLILLPLPLQQFVLEHFGCGIRVPQLVSIEPGFDICGIVKDLTPSTTRRAQTQHQLSKISFSSQACLFVFGICFWKSYFQEWWISPSIQILLVLVA